MLCNIAGYSQNTINSYKYVIVPLKFDFSKGPNQYGLNTTTKQLLEQMGFVAIMDYEPLPPAVAANKCYALKAGIEEKNGAFITSLTLLLKDCQGNIIFKSKEGKSREKEYFAAYNGALKDAFSSLNDVVYKYDSTILAPPQQVAVKTAVPTPVPVSSVKPASTASASALYAQVTANGYQLVDTAPKKILTLLKTSVQDFFIAQGATSNGIVFKRNGEWFFEYYEENKLVSRKLEIRF